TESQLLGFPNDERSAGQRGAVPPTSDIRTLWASGKQNPPRGRVGGANQHHGQIIAKLPSPVNADKK
ncbi:hypothetical protein NKI61_16725, partial [Mesorhizobium sp. M0514]|uniref:hypothetical protein n=1 Tax=Mesorhizobium sp. M0514 TaxID=2956955 RepID=UPI00333A7043